MDSPLDLQTTRLQISSMLTVLVRRHLVRRIAPDADAEDLIALAGKLGEEAAAIEHLDRLRFEPPYPGVTAGPQSIGGARRLLLACRAFAHDGSAVGVVFTTLITGRPPQVSVAPAGASIPEGWRPPDGLR
jgi:hypothetical protein